MVTIAAVGIQVRDNSLEIRRETKKKGGTDLKQPRVQTNAAISNDALAKRVLKGDAHSSIH
jgi:hypothetical protein